MSSKFREALIELLRTIGDSDRQFEYEDEVPIANVPAELICGWFDDLYHPHTRLFLESFSERERGHLARFNDFFEEKSGNLITDGRVRGIQESPEWQEVQRVAQETLKRLEQSVDDA